MGDDFEPAPPVAVPPPPPRIWTRRGMLITVGVVVVVVTAAIVFTVSRPGPGDPGWEPLSGEENNTHSSTGAAGLQFTEVFENDSDGDLTIESVRAEVPAGLVVRESGTLAMGWFSEYYWLTPPTVHAFPVTMHADDQVKLVVRFRVSCPPAVPVATIPWRLYATVRFGSVRQEVKLDSLADIQLTDDALKEFCSPPS